MQSCVARYCYTGQDIKRSAKAWQRGASDNFTHIMCFHLFLTSLKVIQINFSFFFDGITLRLRTAATKGPIALPADDDIWVWILAGMMILIGNTQELGENPVPVSLYPPQIPHELIRARTRASAVGGRRLTAWAMPRPQLIPLLKGIRSFYE
jgi:hypothetical protein